jgi:hypothetical protein
MMKSLLVAATAFALAAPALAQTPGTAPHPKPMAEEAFAKHDADKDGALSLAEVQAVKAEVKQADFDKYDADKSKGLSVAEFAKWVEATHSAPASKPG